MYVSSERYSQKPLVTDVNNLLICQLCRGYLIDATATDTCMHLYCRSCIVTYLKEKTTCPLCGVIVNCLKRDRIYQTLVYKLIPGLYDSEVLRRIEFGKRMASCNKSQITCTLVDPIDEVIHSAQDSIMISLSYGDNYKYAKDNFCRYLECPALFTVHHLKMFIRKKYSLCYYQPIDILCNNISFTDSTSLLDIAYICAWNKIVPMEVQYVLLKCGSGHVSYTNFGKGSEERDWHKNKKEYVSVGNECSIRNSDKTSVEQETSVKSQNDREDCVWCVPNRVETPIENIDSIVNCTNNNVQGVPNSMNIECCGHSSSRASSGIKNVFKIKLSHQRGKKEKYQRTTINTSLQAVIMNNEKQLKPFTKNFDSDEFIPLKSQHKNLTLSCGMEVAGDEYENRVNIQLLQKDMGELQCSDTATNTAQTKYVSGNNDYCSNMCEISLKNGLDNTTAVVDGEDTLPVTHEIQCLHEAHSNKKRRSALLDHDDINNTIPLSSSLKCTFLASVNDKGCTQESYSRQMSNSKATVSVVDTPIITLIEGVKSDPETREVIQVSHFVNSSNEVGEYNNNTIKNKMVEGEVELIGACKETNLPVVINTNITPKCNDGCSDNAEPVTQIYEQPATDLKLVSDEEQLVRQVLKELVARCSVEGMAAKSQELAAPRVAVEMNISVGNKSDCHSNLSCNTSLISAVEGTGKASVPEYDTDVPSLCNRNTDAVNTMQGINVCDDLVKHDIPDGNSCHVTIIVPHVKVENSLSAVKETVISCVENYDEKPDEHVLSAVPENIGRSSLLYIDEKVTNLSISKIDDERNVCKVVPVNQADTSGFVCSSNSKENKKFNKLKLSLSNLTVNQSDTTFTSNMSHSNRNCLHEAKVSPNSVMLDIVPTKDKCLWLNKCTSFTRDLVGPLWKPKTGISDQLGNLSRSDCTAHDVARNIYNSGVAEDKGNPQNELVDDHNCVPITEQSGTSPPLVQCGDEDSLESVEHVDHHTFISSNPTHEKLCASKIGVQNFQECFIDGHNVKHQENGNGETIVQKPTLQPRIVLHRIKRDSSGNLMPPKITKFQCGKINYQQEVAASNSGNVTKTDILPGHAESNEVIFKHKAHLTLGSKHQEDRCSRRGKLTGRLQHQKRPKHVLNTQKTQCLFKGGRNEVKPTNNAEDQYRGKEQDEIYTALDDQMSKTCCTRKRTGSSMAGSSANGMDSGRKRQICRYGSESSVGENLNETCKRVENIGSIGKHKAVCSVRIVSASQPDGRGQRGNESAHVAEAKDVRVIVERCDGKLKQLAASNVPSVINSGNTCKSYCKDLCAKCTQNIHSKLPNFVVMLTRLSLPAMGEEDNSIKKGKITECSRKKSCSSTLKQGSCCDESSVISCKMTQPVMLKPSLVPTLPSASFPQITNSKTTSDLKNTCIDARKTVTFAEEELSEDIEMNIRIMCEL